MIDLRPCFPHTKILREHDGDTVLCDPEFNPGCGYMSMREVKILYELARSRPGRWCEIGSHTGWSAAHVVLAGEGATFMDLIDPEYSVPTFRERTEENLRRVRSTMPGLFKNYF